jgi:5,10-methylenetetrahydrofolate reductase
MAELANEIEMDKSLLELMDRGADAKPFVSIEFFPPKTEAGVTSLYNCLEKLKKVNPLFADVTWGAGGSTSGTCKSPLNAQRVLNRLLRFHF